MISSFIPRFVNNEQTISNLFVNKQTIFHKKKASQLATWQTFLETCNKTILWVNSSIDILLKPYYLSQL